MNVHAVEVRSLQEHKTELTPEMVDGGEISPLHKQLEFHVERTLTFECKCGQRFRKWETAAEHLTEATDGGDDT